MAIRMFETTVKQQMQAGTETDGGRQAGRWYERAEKSCLSVCDQSQMDVETQSRGQVMYFNTAEK